MQRLVGLNFVQPLENSFQPTVAAGSRPAALNTKAILFADDVNVRQVCNTPCLVAIGGRCELGGLEPAPELPAKAAEARRKYELTMLNALSKAPRPIPSLNSGRSVYNTNALMGPEKEYHFAHIWTRAAHFVHLAHEAKVANEQELWEGNQKALSRLTDATEWLSQQCRDSKLKGFFRFQSGVSTPV